MRNRLESLGKKPNFQKRVSIPLTLEEYHNLTSAALEIKTTKSKLLRNLITGKSKPMLLQQ